MQNLRTNVILPKKMVNEIDKVVGKRKRSDFLAKAAQEKLEKIRFERALEKAYGCWTDEDYPEFKTPKDVKKFLNTLREETNKRIQNRIHE